MMFHVEPEAQEGLILAAIIVMILIYRKFTRSGIPRMRVIFLCIICNIVWICSFIFSLMDGDQYHSMLWDTMNLLSMAATLFVLFIALSEILQSPGY